MEIHIAAVVMIAIIAAILLYTWRTNASTLPATNQEQEHFIETYAFPSSIATKIQTTYPHLSSDQVSLALKGLREFFHACQRASKVMVAMPSQVVDVAWHAFILSTRDYERFCQHAFGRFLHHTPAEAMEKPEKAQDGIKRIWNSACTREGIDPKSPHRLPLLFALDTDLEIPDGFTYSLDCQPTGSHSFCAKHIGCAWVPTRKDPTPPPDKKTSVFSRRSGGCGGGCGTSCGGGGCGGD